MDLGDRLRLGAIGLLLTITGFLFIGQNQGVSQHLQVHFLDVGQGDAILITTPDGYEVVIDGGAHGSVARDIARELAWHDRSIDVVIATHPDTDHVGGLVDVLERYDIDMIVQTEVQSDSPAATAFSTATAAENAVVHYARAGQRILVGATTTIEILSPASDTTDWSSNAASVIVQVRYGDTSFMLTGDAHDAIEDYLVGAYGADLQSDVLKLGHHGSKTSTSNLWLDTVQPQYAVVSAGLDNRYNHPDQSVMQRVFARDIETFHTGVDGTVTFYSDGETVWTQ